MNKKLLNNVDLILAALCGLVPLLWFDAGMILKAEDIRLPYTWEKWQQLFYLWHHGWNTGSELIFDNSLIPMMFLPALLQKWGLSLIATQKVMFAFWYALAGFGIVYLLRLLYKGPGALAFRIGGLSFYLFNLWLENVWLGFKPPLITAYAFIPFLLGLGIQIFRGKIGLWKGGSLYFILSFLASGMGNNPSEFGATFAPILIVFASFFIQGKVWKNFGLFRILTAKIIGLLLIWFAANAYWFVPQWLAIYRNVILKMSGEIATTAQLIEWLKGISLSTSFSNVIRTVGDWTWYQGCVDPYRSYSALYKPGTPLFWLSWLVPATVLIGCFHKKIAFKKTFIFLTLAGIFLSMGAHPPLGKIYLWLTEHVPMFWIFRSPYLKFYFWVCLGYTVLFGAACHLIYQACRSKKILGLLFVGLLCLSNLVYAFPITTGKMFHAKEVRTFLPPNRYAIPHHVFETAKWFNEPPSFFRFYSLPGDNPFIYEWGGINYGSFAAEFSNKNLAFPHHHQYTVTAQGPINQSKEILELIREQIYTTSTQDVADLLALLQIKYLLHEKDIRYDFYQGPGYIVGDDPSFIQKKLAKQKGIEKIKSFGPWDIYEVNGETLPLIYGVFPEQIQLLNGNISLLTWWSYQNHSSGKEAFFLNPDPAFQTALPQAREITHQNLLSTADFKKLIKRDSKENQQFQRLVEMELAFTNEIPPKIEEGKTWLWWDGNKDAIYLNNKTDSPIFVNFFLNVFSLELPRSFYVQKESEILKIVNLAGNEKTEILVTNIELKPGKNKIHFYSPYQHSNYQGHGTSFALDKEAFACGRLTFEWPLQSSNDQKRKVRLYSQQSQADPHKPPHVWFDQKAISLQALFNGKKEFWEGSLSLPKGKASLLIEQRDQENYFVEFSPIAEKTSLAKPPSPEVQYELISPVKYKATVQTNAPFVLIFSESFHPCWKAYTLENGQKKVFTVQSKANGFGNGYWIDQIGSYTLWLEFTPQKWFDFFLFISLLGLFLSFVILFLTSITPFKKS